MTKTSHSPLVGAILNMTGAQIHNLSTTQIASLSASDLNALWFSDLPTFTSSQIAALQPATLAALLPATFGSFNKNEVASLTTSQLAALTGDEVATFSVRKLARLSGTQIAAINPAALEGLGAYRLASLTTTQDRALTTRQLDALDTWEIDGLASHPSLNVTPAEIPYLSASRFALLGAPALNALGGAALSSLNSANFTADQIAGLTSQTIAGLTTTFVRSLSSANLAAISTSALAGVSVADLHALSAAQVASFTQAQMAAFTPAQAAVVNAINPLLLQATGFETQGVLTGAGAVSFLEGVAAGGMNANKFAELQALGAKLETPDQTAWSGVDYAIITTAPVVQLFDNVVFGNPQNVGGDLTATSTQSQMQGLINQWFLGSVEPTAPAGAGVVYQQAAVPLYDGSGAPAMTDVLQGALGDSALLAGIAETAFQNAGYLKQLIVDNGDGSYTVEIPDMFNPSFVTVDGKLPVGANSPAAVATSATGAWVGLLEKAAAQMTATHAYAALTSNADSEVEMFSGQYYMPAQFYHAETQSSASQTLANAASAFAAGSNAVLQDGGQYFAVTGIDAVNGLVSLCNPQGGASSTISAATLVSHADTLYYGVTSRASA